MLIAALGLAVYYGSHASIKPEPARYALTPQYLGQAAVALPTDFTVQSGRLAIACPGRPGTTVVMETPHQDYSLVAYEALSIMLPQGPSRIMRDLSLDFGRPAQLVHTTLNLDEVLVSVIADYGTGSLRLSRVAKSRGALSFDEVFSRQAREFMANYSWGHRGAADDDVHSLYGRVGKNTPCVSADLNLLFASEDEKIKIFVSSDKDAATQAQRRGLEMAASVAAEPPSWFAETVKIFKGQWNRKIQGGARLVAGRPGLEWVAIRRDLKSKTVIFTAQWLPEAGAGAPMPAIIINSPLNQAEKALRLWNDILSSSTLAMDFYL
jgi:hypothetical protein